MQVEIDVVMVVLVGDCVDDNRMSCQYLQQRCDCNVLNMDNAEDE
jgi:hypothetical protein